MCFLVFGQLHITKKILRVVHSKRQDVFKGQQHLLLSDLGLRQQTLLLFGTPEDSFLQITHNQRHD